MSSNKQAYKALKEEWEEEYSLIDRAVLSDLLSAQTNDKYNLGSSHRVEYWQNGGDAKKSREIFADCAEAALANAPAYKILTKHLPKTIKTFNDMLEKLMEAK